jgi:hypothetical protein
MTGPPASRAIIHPFVDAFCIGGGPALLFLFVIVTGRRFDDWMTPNILWPIVLFTLPHFMASYRIVYSSRERILRYPWASMIVPAALLAYCVFGVVVSHRSMAFIDSLTIVAGGYLAWHYTGQTWGMMAAFSQLDGRPFSAREHRLVQASLRILLAWHVSWISQASFGLPELLQAPLEMAYQWMSWVTLVAAGLSGVALVSFVRRTGSLPELRVLIAWGTIFFWYGAMARSPRAIYWVQAAHALQYLIFPIRVELNQRLADLQGVTGPVPLIDRAGFQLIVYAAALVFAGILYQFWLPGAIEWGFGSALGPQAMLALPFALNGFLNIHHFFTDGCIWKLSDPSVRRMLFAHVPASS